MNYNGLLQAVFPWHTERAVKIYTNKSLYTVFISSMTKVNFSFNKLIHSKSNTCILSLTCTPECHQPTLTFSMVISPVPRVQYVLLYTINPQRPSTRSHHQYQEADSATPPTYADPQYGNTTSTKSLTCTPIHHQPTITLRRVTSLVPRV